MHFAAAAEQVIEGEDTKSHIIAESGDIINIQVTAYKNTGAQNIIHADIFLNKQGDTIAADQRTETIIEYDNDIVSISDPYSIIDSAKVTKSSDSNKAVFSFSIIFSSEMPLSDVLVRLWDSNRNVAYLHADDVLEIITQEPGTTNDIHDDEPIVEESSEIIQEVIESPSVIQEIVEESAIVQETESTEIIQETIAEQDVVHETIKESSVVQETEESLIENSDTHISDLQCGPGTISVNGICKVSINDVVSETVEPQCGPGTISVDGICKVNINSEPKTPSLLEQIFAWFQII